jgi:hypothetical protein
MTTEYRFLLLYVGYATMTHGMVLGWFRDVFGFELLQRLVYGDHGETSCIDRRTHALSILSLWDGRLGNRCMIKNE